MLSFSEYSEFLKSNQDYITIKYFFKIFIKFWSFASEFYENLGEIYCVGSTWDKIF